MSTPGRPEQGPHAERAQAMRGARPSGGSARDYRALFTAGARTRTVTFRMTRAQTKEQLERVAWGRLSSVTTIPAANWTLTSLERLAYADAADAETG